MNPSGEACAESLLRYPEDREAAEKRWPDSEYPTNGGDLRHGYLTGVADERLRNLRAMQGRARQINEHQALALIEGYTQKGLAIVDAMVYAGLNLPPVCDAPRHERWCSEDRPCAYTDATKAAAPTGPKTPSDLSA